MPRKWWRSTGLKVKKEGAAGMGGHTSVKLLGKGAGPPCRDFLAGGRIGPVHLWG